MLEILKVVLENVHLWELTLLIVVVWVGRNPEYLKIINSIKVGDIEIKIKQLEQEVTTRKEEIHELEQEIENNKRLFGDLLVGFDASSPMPELAKIKTLLKANARALDDLNQLGDFLEPGVSAEQLYAAAVTLRERRPTELFDKVIACLDRLANDNNLGGLRLNTIWTLTSAVHFMLVASIRDSANPKISTPSLHRAKAVLEKLDQNPLVKSDRPDKPEKGIRGPIKYARTWIDKALD